MPMKLNEKLSKSRLITNAMGPMHNIMMSPPEGKWGLGTNERKKVWQDH